MTLNEWAARWIETIVRPKVRARAFRYATKRKATATIPGEQEIDD